MWEVFTGTEGNIALGAILGAGGTLIAQTAAGLSGLIKELIFERRKHRAEAHHLALRTILALDEFVGQCYGAVHDTPQHNPVNFQDFQFRNPEPDLKLPADADWRALEPALMGKVIWLPAHFNNVRDGLNTLDRSAPDFDDYFEHRTEHYANLGLRALDLLEALCREYGIEEPERPDYYNPRKGLTDKRDKIKRFWQRRHQQTQAMFAEMKKTRAENSTP
ncbi:hypothetical protein [Sinorhizobium meliloti]|uniref:hypothetical protein n=1 Tax=Rhizobium meliloti TaxID=382 RepID=UPI000FD80044|nr:hypothetical protein [Sinorhizobium meliloti]RVO68363.1 hypothetical protein CN087_12880 [Sinorhizobium meliloti]